MSKEYNPYTEEKKAVRLKSFKEKERLAKKRLAMFKADPKMKHLIGQAQNDVWWAIRSGALNAPCDGKYKDKANIVAQQAVVDIFEMFPNDTDEARNKTKGEL